MNEFNVIRLDEKYTDCTICNKETILKYFAPMYEGRMVDTYKTDEWAGMPLCIDCYNNLNVRGIICE